MFQAGETHQTAVLEVPGYVPGSHKAFLPAFCVLLLLCFYVFGLKKNFISRNIVPYCFTLLVYSVYLLHY